MHVQKEKWAGQRIKGEMGRGGGGGHRRKRKPEYGEERKIEADILIEICYTFVPKMAGNLAYFK